MKEEELAEVLESLGLNEALIEKFYPRIIEPLGKPSQMNLSSRVFFYWTEKGVIDISKTSEGQSPWSRLNILEIFWIRIVKELRKFNLPFDCLVDLKKEMFGSAITLMRENPELTKEEINNSIDHPLAKEVIENILDSSDSDFEEFVKENPYLFCLITGIIAEIMLNHKSINLIVYKDKKNFCFTLEGIKNNISINKELEEIKKGAYLIVNLRNLIAEYLLEPDLEKLNEDFGFITKFEKELIIAIREKNVREIYIKKDDNEVISYTSTSIMEIKNDQVTAIKRLLRMNEFNEVRAILRNEKHLYIENKKKVKIRPDNTAL